MKLKSYKEIDNYSWDFWKDGVTQSFLGTWILNRSIAKAAYVDGWYSPNQSDSLIFGNIVHAILEAAYLHNIKPTEAAIEKSIDEYYNKLLTNNVKMDKSQFDACALKAIPTAQIYFMCRENDFEEEWEGTEEVFKVPYEYPDGYVTNLTGMIDAFKKPKVDKLEIMDHKCKGRINTDTQFTLLEVDLQTHLYAYARQKSLGTSQDVVVTYNLIRNVGIKQNSRTKETADAYKTRVRNRLMDDLEDSFPRLHVHIKNDDLHFWKKHTLDPLMNDVRLWVESGYRAFDYNTHVNLETQFGLHSLARYVVHGDVTGLAKKATPFTELVELI